MHPGKGATLSILPAVYDDVVSIHAPWEGCDLLRPWLSHPHVQVSIHAPWEGCDFCSSICWSSTLSFNSRTLGRVRRCSALSNCYTKSVSIHAPWEGCDLRVPLPSLSMILSFQFTHPGKGATPLRCLCRCCLLSFQFTHPGKGATQSLP